ncbi:MAG: lipopolysaccharide biosynthesis protein, partial [Alphaproteobacteria bacterium]|nr:lipopolysaccharide biosynthesis protein [Alphaproteobacteria bacterium]
MLRSAALRQAVLYGLGILVTKGVSLAMLPVVTAHLPPAEYGRLEVLQALADICSILVGFGLVD